MPTAELVLPDGTRVTINGSADEVANLLQRFSGGNAGGTTPNASASKSRRRRSDASPKTTRAKSAPRGPAEYIRELIIADFFKTKRGLGDVQKKLEEGAHIYPITHLSPVLFRLVRAKELRRMKEGGTWKYVNP